MRQALALVYSLLLLAAHLVCPTLGAIQPATSSGARELQQGKWPFTPDEASCMAQQGQSSEPLRRFIAVGALLGSALLYGDGPETAELLATPTVQSLLDTPIQNITAAAAAWARDAMAVCGVPQLVLPSGSDKGPAGSVLWLSSISEADLLAAAGYNMTPANPAALFAPDSPEDSQIDSIAPSSSQGSSTGSAGANGANATPALSPSSSPAQSSPQPQPSSHSPTSPPAAQPAAPSADSAPVLPQTFFTPFDMGAGGRRRRLLWSLANVFGADLRQEVAAALGLACGVASGVFSSSIGLSVTLGISVGTTPVCPVGGWVAGLMAGSMISSGTQDALDAAFSQKFNSYTADKQVREAFAAAQDFGRKATSVVQAARGLASAAGGAWDKVKLWRRHNARAQRFEERARDMATDFDANNRANAPRAQAKADEYRQKGAADLDEARYIAAQKVADEKDAAGPAKEAAAEARDAYRRVWGRDPDAAASPAAGAGAGASTAAGLGPAGAAGAGAAGWIAPALGQPANDASSSAAQAKLVEPKGIFTCPEGWLSTTAAACVSFRDTDFNQDSADSTTPYTDVAHYSPMYDPEECCKKCREFGPKCRGWALVSSLENGVPESHMRLTQPNTCFLKGDTIAQRLGLKGITAGYPPGCKQQG